ncbi:MAG: HEAT repeat domain-containing protein [Myxococcota bacterium]
MRVASGLAVLGGVIAVCGAVQAQMPLDGVEYTGQQFELVKRVSASQRSVINPQGAADADSFRRRTGEAQKGIDHLGHELGPFMASLRQPTSPYPLLKDVILDYTHLRHREQSDANGRMYIMFIGELYWPFPAPLLADLVRIRVASPLSQGIRDLLGVALRRWGRDNIEPVKISEDSRRREIEGWLEDLEAPALFGVRWKRDQVVNELLRARLLPADVHRLRAAARDGDATVRVSTLRVLGTGGWVEDPEFFAVLLADESVAVQRAAFWSLVFMRGNGNLAHLRSYAGRDEALAARVRQVLPVATELEVAIDIAAFNRTIGAPYEMPDVTKLVAVIEEPLPAGVIDASTSEMPDAPDAPDPTPIGDQEPLPVPPSFGMLPKIERAQPEPGE